MQYGQYIKSSYTRNINGTITLPTTFSTTNYSIVISPYDKDSTNNSTMDVCNTSVQIKSKTQFNFRVFGHGESDHSHGMVYISVGY